MTPADTQTARKKSRKGDILKMIVFLGIGIFFIYWFLLKLEPEQKASIWQSFVEADYAWVGVAMAVCLLSHLVRALRWRLLFRPIGYNPNEASWKPTAEYLQEELPKVFNGRIQLKSVTYSTSTTEFKKGTDQWDLSPNDWSRTLSRTYPHAAFYYFTSGYANHPNVYVDAEFDAQYAVCDSDEVRMNYDRLLDETAKLEKIYLDKVIHIPVCQEVGYELYSDRVVLPMKQYLPVIGWGLPYGDWSRCS